MESAATPFRSQRRVGFENYTLFDLLLIGIGKNSESLKRARKLSANYSSTVVIRLFTFVESGMVPNSIVICE